MIVAMDPADGSHGTEPLYLRDAYLRFVHRPQVVAVR